MSCSTAFLIKKDGQIVEAEEWRNGHGTGPRVWSAVARRYLGADYWTVLDGKNDRRFWDLWKDPSLPRAWRAALLWTYDYAIVEHARFREIADLLCEFSAESERWLPWPCHVNHLPAAAAFLRAHADDADLTGACFQMTSVSEDVWHPWDSEKDESTTYDVKDGGRHFSVGFSLDNVGAPSSPDAKGAPEHAETKEE